MTILNLSIWLESTTARRSGHLELALAGMLPQVHNTIISDYFLGLQVYLVLICLLLFLFASLLLSEEVAEQDAASIILLRY